MRIPCRRLCLPTLLAILGGTTTYWSNDGSRRGGSEPTAAAPAAVFQNADVRLRICFSSGSGFALLSSGHRASAQLGGQMPTYRDAANAYAGTIAAISFVMMADDRQSHGGARSMTPRAAWKTRVVTLT